MSQRQCTGLILAGLAWCQALPCWIASCKHEIMWAPHRVPNVHIAVGDQKKIKIALSMRMHKPTILPRHNLRWQSG